MWRYAGKPEKLFVEGARGWYPGAGVCRTVFRNPSFHKHSSIESTLRFAVCTFEELLTRMGVRKEGSGKSRSMAGYQGVSSLLHIREPARPPAA